LHLSNGIFPIPDCSIWRPPAGSRQVLHRSDAWSVRGRQRIKELDPRYYTSYYVIDAVNFAPVDLSSAVDTLDAPYLPLVVLEGAGVPLDPSFAEQKKILSNVVGSFYLCKGGAGARRFNRLLIEAGLINGL